MKPTERYLKQATRGLWGRARRELRAELSGHLNERVAELRLGNLSVDEAERQALRELGAPQQVSVGMLGVHTVPALGKTGALGLLMATVLFSTLPQGLAQVRGIYSESVNGYAYPASYLDFEQLKTELRKAGGELKGPPHAATVSLPGGPRLSEPVNTFGWSTPIANQGGKTYLQADVLVSALQSTGCDLRLSGWKNLTLTAGKSVLAIEASDWQVASNLYTVALQYSDSSRWNTLKIPFSLIAPGVLSESLNLSGQFQQGNIYTLLIPELIYWSSTALGNAGEAISGNLNLISSANQAQAGSVQFHVPAGFKDFRLYATLAEFNAALEPYLKETTALVKRWDAKHPAPVLVLELSGHFGPDAFKVVSPKTIKRQ